MLVGADVASAHDTLLRVMRAGLKSLTASDFQEQSLLALWYPATPGRCTFALAEVFATE